MASDQCLYVLYAPPEATLYDYILDLFIFYSDHYYCTQLITTSFINYKRRRLISLD